MDIPGIMKRALARDGIKTAGVRVADILHFPGQGRDCIVHRQSYNPGNYIPSCPAWCTSFDLDTFNPATRNFNLVFRQAELFAVFACSLQASQAASCKRC